MLTVIPACYIASDIIESDDTSTWIIFSSYLHCIRTESWKNNGFFHRFFFITMNRERETFRSFYIEQSVLMLTRFAFENFPRSAKRFDVGGKSVRESLLRPGWLNVRPFLWPVIILSDTALLHFHLHVSLSGSMTRGASAPRKLKRIRLVE